MDTKDLNEHELKLFERRQKALLMNCYGIGIDLSSAMSRPKYILLYLAYSHDYASVLAHKNFKHLSSYVRVAVKTHLYDKWETIAPHLTRGELIVCLRAERFLLAYLPPIGAMSIVDRLDETQRGYIEFIQYLAAKPSEEEKLDKLTRLARVLDGREYMVGDQQSTVELCLSSHLKTYLAKGERTELYYRQHKLDMGCDYETKFVKPYTTALKKSRDPYVIVKGNRAFTDDEVYERKDIVIKAFEAESSLSYSQRVLPVASTYEFLAKVWLIEKSSEYKEMPLSSLVGLMGLEKYDGLLARQILKERMHV